jgi:integrase
MSVYLIKGKGWRFDFTLRGKRFTSNWFRSKAEANMAEARKREEVMQPDADLPPREPEPQLPPEPHMPPELNMPGELNLAPQPPPAMPPTPTPTGMVFSDLANNYLDHAQRKFTTSTYKFKANVYREFLALAGDLQVEHITIQIIEAYLKTRPTNINYNRHRKELCALFTWARRRRYLAENPLTYVDKMPEPKFQRRIPTPEEMSRILLAAGPERPFLLVMYHTLARVDEILRLKWEDVNFRERTVRLWTRKRRDGSWAWDVLPMNQVLYDTLGELWQHRLQDKWVFFNTNTGTRFMNRPKIMQTICKRAGVRHFGFHAIRHYVASLLADQKKFSITQISRLLRHQSKATTERYLQAVDSQLREVLASLEEKSHIHSHTESLVETDKGSPGEPVFPGA